jgi:chemotaxis protein MotA
MDFTTIVGIILTFVMIVYSAVSGSPEGFGAVMRLVHFPSIVLVIGGTLSIFVGTYTIEQLKEVGKIASKAFKSPVYDSKATIASIIELANIARKEGLLALEEVAAKIEDPFMQKAVNLMVDGTDPVLLKDILEAEIGATEDRHKVGAGMFEGMALIAPAVGMLGTVIGLIGMLNSLDDPSGLGPGMSIALITTFYGSLMANIFCNPIASKLKTRSQQEVLQKELILEGVLSIHGGENPHIIQEKLHSFLSRTQLTGGGKGKGKTEEVTPDE